MEFKDLAASRRSTRKYQETHISEEEINELITFVRNAPSWKNLQPARYYAAISDEAIEAVRNALPGFNQNSSANAAYIVSSFKKGLSGSLSEGQMDEAGDLWGAYDLGLQNAYLILEAREMGYDTLIMGIRDTDAIRKYFAIPEDEIILPVIAIGKRNEDPAMRPRKEVKEILKVK